MIRLDHLQEFIQNALGSGMGAAVAAFVIAFLVCLFLIPHIIRLSARHNLLDKPNERKVHKAPVSRLGGAGIVAGILISSPLWFLHGGTVVLLHVLAGMLILVAVGVIDDLRELSPGVKFLGQVVAALFLAHAGLLIDNLFGIFGLGQLPVIIQYLITVFIVAGVINAFNLIDGIDRLFLSLPPGPNIQFCHPGRLRGRRPARIFKIQLPPGPDLHGRHRLDGSGVPPIGRRADGPGDQPG
jgi:hypothetical protein